MENLEELSVRESLTRRVHSRARVNGQIAVPAVPGLLEEYVQMCTDTFGAVGAHFSDEETAHLRDVLRGQLAEAYQASSRSEILISYESGQGATVSYQVKAQWFTIEGAYDNWVATREPPYFGTEPDARVWALAYEVACEAGYQTAEPTGVPVLDIGAGTGRNSLPLARRGHPVDAVEMSPKFAEIIRTEVQREALSLRVIESGVASSEAELRSDYRLILLSEVVSDFRSTEQLAGVFDLAARRLVPGGRLVFNVFLPCDGYTPDSAVREFGQQCYTSIFTREELAAASAGLPLELLTDDSVYEYERDHLPPEAWPPTSWYGAWVSGQDVFAVEREASPIQMRWLVYRKTG